MQDVFTTLRNRFENDPFPTLKTRLARLKAIENLLKEYAEPLCEAVTSDFGSRSSHETRLTEIVPLLREIKYLEEHLPIWMQDESRPVNFFAIGAKAKVLHVPLGVVGIIAPWNFPILLAISPLLTALAAGNVAMIKMSEYTHNTTRVLKEAIERHLDGFVAISAGHPDTNHTFSEIPFDHIFFTGSQRVGSLVMAAAARNLTPVTLELGGKCPVLAAPDFKLEKLCEKLIWAKSLNAGQICVAPDYLVCPEDRLEAIIDSATKVFQRMYPNGVQDTHLTSIISELHFQRLQEYLEEAKSMGVKILSLSPDSLDVKARKMAVHLIINPPTSSRLAQEEIFGPLLPLFTYGDFSEVKAHLQRSPNPLALYLFTEDQRVISEFEYQVSSGALCINDLIVHLTQEELPFGGVRQSGMGQYHGIEGFLTFTRPKTVFHAGKLSLLKWASAPYQNAFLRWFYKRMSIGP